MMKKMHSKSSAHFIQVKRTQRGVMILEAMIAILIFSLGILALMALQAAAIRLSGDAKGRTDAAFLADRLIGEMWLVDQTTLATFAHNPTPSADPCLPSGGAASATISTWINNNVLPVLPSATATRQRVSILPGNVVEVSLCWQMPGEAATSWHNYVSRSTILKNLPPVL
jgi:type IV pilus assembly protein PilV